MDDTVFWICKNNERKNGKSLKAENESRTIHCKYEKKKKKEKGLLSARESQSYAIIHKFNDSKSWNQWELF